MEKLAKYQRHVLYKHALEVYAPQMSVHLVGLCWALKKAAEDKFPDLKKDDTQDPYWVMTYANPKKYLPEFWNFSDIVNEEVYFGGTDIGREERGYRLRKIILEFCIEMTK